MTIFLLQDSHVSAVLPVHDGTCQSKEKCKHSQGAHLNSFPANKQPISNLVYLSLCVRYLLDSAF